MVVLQEWRSPDMWSANQDIYGLFNNANGLTLDVCIGLVHLHYTSVDLKHYEVFQINAKDLRSL